MKVLHFQNVVLHILHLGQMILIFLMLLMVSNIGQFLRMGLIELLRQDRPQVLEQVYQVEEV